VKAYQDYHRTIAKSFEKIAKILNPKTEYKMPVRDDLGTEEQMNILRASLRRAMTSTTEEGALQKQLSELKERSRETEEALRRERNQKEREHQADRDELSTHIEALCTKQDDMQDDISDMENEIKYLKMLCRTVNDRLKTCREEAAAQVNELKRERDRFQADAERLQKQKDWRSIVTNLGVQPPDALQAAQAAESTRSTNHRLSDAVVDMSDPKFD
jgi:chromosome segregation ATPase